MKRKADEKREEVTRGKLDSWQIRAKEKVDEINW